MCCMRGAHFGAWCDLQHLGEEWQEKHSVETSTQILEFQVLSCMLDCLPQSAYGFILVGNTHCFDDEPTQRVRDENDWILC